MTLNPQSSLSADSVSANFTRRIGHELHQVAQPLTILQGLLELALLKAHTVQDYQNSVQGALEQLQRAMLCFARAREILQSQPIPMTTAIEERKSQHV